MQHVAPALLFGLSLIVPAQAANLYRLTDLGVLPGQNFSFASAINEAGEVVGGSWSPPGQSRAFLWTASGGMQDLDELPGGSVSSYASAINDAGQVVGLSDTAAGPRAFLWTSASGMQNLGTLPGIGVSLASDINNSGQVVGTSDIDAFLWTNSSGMTPLLPGGPSSAAFGINNSGQVVGRVAISGASSHAFLWTNGVLQDLGDLPGGEDLSGANDVNDVGQVVGASAASGGDGYYHAFLWTSDAGMQDLGVLPGLERSGAYAINNSGDVVGHRSTGFGSDPDLAFLWTSEDGMQDLDKLLDGSGAGWELRIAEDINDAGQIVGWGRAPDGNEQRGFLLTPVPEPSSSSLATCALLIVAAHRVRLRRDL
jgi:probable HAF family extracellular repeat protein